ncbi:restriction endonuclease subunit S [Azospirillum sp. SYSU D00513]|uniref:restriction endonuclease subunit S n=1 Tax=Azospirillum sp. SYSU D00513 TaxID=2812561 RepID=UPI001A95FE84|nr:restriction endonuclease subunit S [Azospirillum sp. SYSU D00513]
MSGRELPAGWVQHQLRDLGTWRGGGTPSKAEPEYWENGSIPWVSPKDMKRSTIDDAEDYITEAAVEGSACNLIPAGSVLMVTRSGILAHSFPVATTNRPVTINQDMKALTPSSGLVPEYLRLALVAEKQSILKQCSKAGTTVASISSDRLSDFGIPVPPSNEQRRIVEKIEALTARSRRARESLDALPALIDRYRQSIFSIMFGDDHVENKVAISSPDAPSLEITNATSTKHLPREWRFASLGEVAPLLAGYAFSSKGFKKSGVRLLKGVNVRNGWISEESVDFWDSGDVEQYKRFSLRQGDIVLAMDRPVYSSGSKEAKVAKLGPEWDGALLLQRVGKFQVSDDVEPEYLYLFLRSHAFRKYIISQQNGTQDGKDLPHVSAGVVNSCRMPLPSKEEQRRIASQMMSHLERFEIVKVVARTAIERLSTLDQSILAKAFRGELVPQDPNDEPASVLLERIRAERAAGGEKPRRGRARKAG